ncbi:MAG: hypothetical protein ACXWL5_04635, partial [Candidatus Chromulinivorax sp.]
TSNVSPFSDGSSVGLSFENLKLDSQEQSFRYNLENGLEPESGYTSPSEELSKKNLENKFSPGQKKILSPEKAKEEVIKSSLGGIISPRISAVCRRKLIPVRKMKQENTIYEDALSQNAENKKQLKRERSDSFGEDNRKLSKY